MGHHSPKSHRINRRSLLTAGVTLAGGAALTVSMSGQEAPKTAATRPAAPAVPANLHPPVVAVKGGKLRGFKDGRILTFLGIPYAEAERFEMPKPVKAWAGIKSAQSWGPECPQPAHISYGDEFIFPKRFWLEDENCQVLNIWTQSTIPKTKKPVLVWMHGGGYREGSSMRAYAVDGKSLCEFGDVVVVSVNHRLNIIGLLDLSAYGAQYANSRNTGMADLVAALEWIHENIEVFGGDPGNVTIFGQSGGGGKVTHLMHIPSAKGLFHKVICQSGPPVNYRETNPREIIKVQQAVAAETLRNLGLDASQMDKLKKVPYRELLAAGIAAIQTAGKQLGPFPWEPVADDVYVLREFCDWADSIPFIAGNVMSEFNSNLREMEVSKNEWTPEQIEDRLTAAFGGKKDEAVAEFRKVYPGKKVQDVLFVDNNTRVRRGTKKLLARKLEKAKAPVYSYMFTYEHQVNGGITAWHCSEIAFVFHALKEPHIRRVAGDAPSALALQDKISQAWVNFARTGNPSQPGLAWKPYSLAGKETMIFDTVSVVRFHDDDKLRSLLPPPPARG